MSDTNSPYVPPVTETHDLHDHEGHDHDHDHDGHLDHDHHHEEVVGETMSDGKVPVDGDTMSNNDELEAHTD